jgi:hypothetical protein
MAKLWGTGKSQRYKTSGTWSIEMMERDAELDWRASPIKQPLS